MFNTTTIPTVIETPHFLHTIFSCLLATVPFWASILRIIYKERNSGTEEDSDEEEEQEEKKYMEEFNALTDRELSESDWRELVIKNVKETIEGSEQDFEIVMTYNKESETFWYFTNNLKEVSYETLETVARKFVIEHDCKRLYLQVEAAGEKTVEQEEESVEQEPVERKSVFAKFKKYNSGIKGNSQSTFINEEQTNHFRYKGKLYQYEETLKEEGKKINPLLDYATYKLLMQLKKEN
jgi:hypothetical protein